MKKKIIYILRKLMNHDFFILLKKTIIATDIRKISIIESSPIK
tara:strand:+ start:950 stop:1078 length:129 start_codon:yes stop_codon:yes gene_type:complete